MAKNKKPTFEELLQGLEKSANELAKPGITLEEALQSFEDGMKYYDQCNEALREATQRIEVYSKQGE